MKTAATSSPLDIGEEFIDTYHELRRLVDQALAAHSSSLSRLKLLTVLGENGATRTSALAKELGIAVRSAMDAIESLERDAMVARQPDPEDRRAVLISITPRGRQALRKALRVRETIMTAAFGTLSAAERTQLVTMLGKIRSALG